MIKNFEQFVCKTIVFSFFIRLLKFYITTIKHGLIDIMLMGACPSVPLNPTRGQKCVLVCRQFSGGDDKPEMTPPLSFCLRPCGEVSNGLPQRTSRARHDNDDK